VSRIEQRHPDCVRQDIGDARLKIHARFEEPVHGKTLIVKKNILGGVAVATRMPSMTEPSGYVLELLREGPDFSFYRGRQPGHPSPVLVIALDAEQPSSQSLRRLEHEYSLAGELDPGWAARPLALTRHEGRTILVLKDAGGEPLDRVLERDQGQPLDLTRVLRIVISLATALGQVHRHGLIHKDIKPANVLVDDADNVWLTDFGIASQLPHECQAPVPPEIIAGTLAYMSPEQTGRMNRSIGTSSDLYSLGITLYQMLTGALPFAAADPMEWVHCHIARQPIPPVDRAAVPEPLSAIVMNLLAKNSEERYQTASGPGSRSSAVSGRMAVAWPHRSIPIGGARRIRPVADP
jgi:serine/threonine protein kinase